jgi:hypothetical protein
MENASGNPAPPFPPPFPPAPPAWVHPPYRHPPEAAWVPVRGPKREPQSAPFRAKEIAIAVGLAAVVDLVAYGPDGLGAGGYGLSLFFFLVPMGMLLAARRLRVTPRAIVVGIALAVAALRCAYAPTAGTVLGGLCLLFAFGLVVRTKRMFVPEAFASSLAAIRKLPSRIAALFVGARSLFARTRLGKVSVLPVVVPLALTALFAGVFALANPVVAHGLGVAGDFVARVVGLPAPARIVLFALSVGGAAALLRPAIIKPRSIEAAWSEGEATPIALGIARNALVMLNVIFLAYNALDAAYLWSGSPPAGMRTQQYAHEGAFWTTVALVMLTVVVGVMFRGALAHDARAKLARKLAFVWCAQGAVLAAGTYRRIAIHIAKSGLSDLRIVGILGTTLVVCGVALVAWKLHRQRTFVWLVRRQLDAFALTVFFYAVFPTHLVSAKVNVARIQAGEYRPVMHMFRQAQNEESAAAVLPLLDHPDVRVRQGVAVLLDEERERLHTSESAGASWRRRSYAETSTKRALDDSAPKIATVLGSVNRYSARKSLYEVMRVANEDRSLEEILAVPSADADENASSTRNVY